MTDLHEANGARFIAADDMIVRWERTERRRFEPETTIWLFHELEQRAGVFVDVGAATGWFAIPVALRGHDVIAIEPNPAVWERLQQNIDINGARLEAFNVAASREQGKATFYRNPRVPLTSGGSIEAPTCNGPERLQVPTIPLDQVCFGRDVALIKVDVEGHEMAVLEGAAATIARCRPLLMLEANTDAHRDALASWLAANGYVWRQADTRNMLCAPAS